MFVLTLCSAGVFLHGQNSTSLRSQLVGTWRFVSSTQQLTDGTTRPDPQTGTKGVGYLVYAKGGQLCVVAGNSERAPWKSVQAPTESEVRNAFDGLVAYAARSG